ncbi:AraC family transcriptional regulator [Spirosoma lituiforme]
MKKRKTLIQKPQIDPLHSFACREYTTPEFESSWHKHDDYEIILITRGHGTLLMGDYIGLYHTGEIYFIASKLPHSFRKENPEMVGSAIVVHFRRDIFGDTFLEMPELKAIHKLLKRQEGIRLEKDLKDKTRELLVVLGQQNGFTSLSTLLRCLDQIAASTSWSALTNYRATQEELIDPTIEAIFEFSFKNYLTPITLSQVAAEVSMTIPTFCRFFKKNVKKSYFDFLQEVRVGHACKLLSDTTLPILDICFKSGFNSWAHFSKKFKEIKQTTPSKYRIEFGRS